VPRATCNGVAAAPEAAMSSAMCSVDKTETDGGSTEFLAIERLPAFSLALDARCLACVCISLVNCDGSLGTRLHSLQPPRMWFTLVGHWLWVVPANWFARNPAARTVDPSWLLSCAVIPCVVLPQDVIDEDWEEWDASKGKFWHHMLAGSCAGVMEHTAMFPFDTYKVRPNVGWYASLVEVSMPTVHLWLLLCMGGLTYWWWVCTSGVSWCLWSRVLWEVQENGKTSHPTPQLGRVPHSPPPSCARYSASTPLLLHRSHAQCACASTCPWLGLEVADLLCLHHPWCFARDV
jgi:hypothetical protein